MTVPYPDPVMIAVLAELPALADLGGRISVDLDSVLPAARITKVRDLEAPSAWEATPIFQVEIWGEDALVTGRLAWDLKNVWPSVVKQRIGDALVTGRWVDVDPNPSPDRETGLARHLLSLGIRLSGVNA